MDIREILKGMKSATGVYYNAERDFFVIDFKMNEAPKPEIEELIKRFAVSGYAKTKVKIESHDKARAHIITTLIAKRGAA